MIFTILEEETGKVLYGATHDQIENLPTGQIAIEQQPTELLENMHFNFETQKFYENN
jgi:hypothetical protein